MDFLVGLIIFIIIALPLIYIIKSKKKGVACIGCPYAKACSGKCSELTQDNIDTKK